MTGAPRGVLHLVVGPSGAGKDTLLAAAMAVRPDILFPRRVITRPEGAGGEPHIAATMAEFDAAEASGAFALSWRAHGLAYGVPADVAEALAAGRHVAVNVSRAVIPLALSRLAPVRVLAVTASPAALADRLAARGREDAADIAARLARAAFALPDGVDAAMIRNDGSLAKGVAAMLAALAPPPVNHRAPDGAVLDPSAPDGATLNCDAPEGATLKYSAPDGAALTKCAPDGATLTKCAPDGAALMHADAPEGPTR
ncbi:MAG: ribose 1,5-bisphosphokinase [Paracoccaceae bacterium]|jgi:ribose 1,5-bisphosphokinase